MIDKASDNRCLIVSVVISPTARQTKTFANADEEKPPAEAEKNPAMARGHWVRHGGDEDD
jgi:hypothetical protein